MSKTINNLENIEFELDDNSILSNLFGINDSNLKNEKHQLHVYSSHPSK